MREISQADGPAFVHPNVVNDDEPNEGYLKYVLAIVLCSFIGIHYLYLIYAIYAQHNINIVFIYALIFLFMTILAVCIILILMSMKSLLRIVQKKTH